MSKRIDRVNELLRREISEILHTRYRSKAVAITISGVDCSPDLRKARVYFSVVGDAERRIEAETLFRQAGRDIRFRVGKAVVLKYLPDFEFVFDPSMERGAGIIRILDELDQNNG